MKAITTDAAVIDRFGVNRPIEKIEWIKPDHYRRSGGGRYLDIAIKDVLGTTPMPGARRFVLVPSTFVCK